MFQALNDVPDPIQEFYVETVVQVPTGNYYTEHYYEDGVRKSREVEYLRDEIQVITNFSDDLKSWDEVSNVVSLGKPRSVIDTFIQGAIENDKKTFHDAYIAWMVESDEVFEYNNSRVPDEEGIIPPSRNFPLEPIYVPTDADKYLLEVAKGDRDTGRYAPITVDGLTYDATQEAYDNLQGMVNSWETMIADQALIDAGLVVDGRMYWTLADNSNVLVAKEMLAAVVNAIRLRAGLLHAQYQFEKSALEVNS